MDAAATNMIKTETVYSDSVIDTIHDRPNAVEAWPITAFSATRLLPPESIDRSCLPRTQSGLDGAQHDASQDSASRPSRGAKPV